MTSRGLGDIVRGRGWLGAIGVATLLMCLSPAQALDSANVLPEGLNSPAIRMGIVGGIGQKYTSSGQLQTLSDVHSMTFDSRTLSQVEPRARQLINVLNQFGHQNLGDSLSLGLLRIETNPEIRYLAPLHAYGLTKRWTVAVGLPIVTYDNKMSLSQSGSNVSAIQARVGNGIPELNEAFAELQKSLVASVQKELAQKGYRPLEDRHQTIYGDLQLAAIYRFPEQSKWAAAAKTLVNLPTGPGDDPDDLADLNIFGESAIEEILIGNYTYNSRLQLASKLAYRWIIPDKIVKRVPKDESDTLPAQDRKEQVSRDRGDVVTLGASGRYRLFDRISAGAGYELMSRGGDRYSGGRGWDFGRLGKDTGGHSARVRFGAEYSSTAAYMAQQALIPLIFSYEYSDTVAGRNVERQTVHEFWLTMFF